MNVDILRKGTTMGDLIKELVGSEVALWTAAGQSSYKDTGVLEAFDGAFFRLRSEDGKVKYFSIYLVRLIEQEDRRSYNR